MLRELVPQEVVVPIEDENTKLIYGWDLNEQKLFLGRNGFNYTTPDFNGLNSQNTVLIPPNIQVVKLIACDGIDISMWNINELIVQGATGSKIRLLDCKRITAKSVFGSELVVRHAEELDLGIQNSKIKIEGGIRKSLKIQTDILSRIHLKDCSVFPNATMNISDCTRLTIWPGCTFPIKSNLEGANRIYGARSSWDIFKLITQRPSKFQRKCNF